MTVPLSHMIMVRGGVTAAHVFALYGLLITPGSDVYTPEACGDDPLENPRTGAERFAAGFFMFLAAATLAVYWHVCLSDAGATGAAFMDMPPPRKARATLVFDPEREYIGGVCRWCNRLKLLRTKHCRACGKCFYRFDHHCGWTCNCVAGGNRQAFVLYLGLQMSFIVLCTAMVVRAFVEGPPAERIAVPVILLLLAMVSAGFVGILIKMHVGFVATAGSTYETLYKGFAIPAIRDPQDDNPFNVRSAMGNIMAFFRGHKSEIDSLPTNWRAPF